MLQPSANQQDVLITTDATARLGIGWDSPLPTNPVQDNYKSFGTQVFQTISTATTLHRKFETNVPRKGTARQQSQFLHSCSCERFICYPDRSAYSAAEK
jgi:hypothetical protein